MIFGEHQPNDLTLYYKGGLSRLRFGKDVAEWVLINNFDFVGDKLRIEYFHPNHKKELPQTVLYRDKPEPNFIPEYPESKFYFYQGQSYYLYRVSRRNATKSISQENAVFTNPLCQLVVRAPKLEDNWRTWCQILQIGQVYFPLTKVNRLFDKGNAASFPLSAHWCVSLSPNEGNKLMLFHRTVAVGLLNDKVVTPINDIFVQEIRDTFPDLMVK